MYLFERAWKTTVHWNEKFESRDGNSQHPRIDSSAEVAGLGSDYSDTFEEIIEPGFYRPANCEDGDPMKNEEKLRSFTGPLVGYETSGRVAVILQNVNRTGERGHPRILDTASDTLSPNFILLSGFETVHKLREIKSDLGPQRPLCVSPRESRTIAPVASSEIKLTDRTYPRSTDTKDIQTPEHESSPSSEMTTNSFGAVGDGRLAASSQILPSSGRSMGQTGRGSGRIDYLRGGNSIKSNSRLPDSPANRCSQRGLKSMNPKTDSVTSSLESFPPPHEALSPSQLSKSGEIRHGIGQASYNNSDPPSSMGTGPSFARRVSRALPPTNLASSGKHGAAEAFKALVGQNQAPLATGTVDAIKLAASRRESPKHISATRHADQDINRASPRSHPAETSSPRTFSLPSGTVVFIMKSDHTHDIDAAVKNGIWSSSDSGNRVLDSAWRGRKPGETIVIFFSVVRSSQYCGLAEMTGPYNEDARPNVFSEKDRQGIIPIRWIFIKYAAFKHFENVISSKTGLSVNELRNASRVPDDTARAMIQTYLVAPSEALTNVKRDYPFSSRPYLGAQSGADHRGSDSTGCPSKPQQSVPQPAVSLLPRTNVSLLSAPAVPLPPRPGRPLPSAPPMSLPPRPAASLPARPPKSLPPRPNVPLPPPIEHLPYQSARVGEPISLPPASSGVFRPGRVVGATNLTFHERSFHERILSQGQYPTIIYAVDAAHFLNHSSNIRQASSIQRQPSDGHATRNFQPIPTGPSNMRHGRSNSGQLTQEFSREAYHQNARSRGFRPNP